MDTISLERALAGGDLRQLDEAQRTELVVKLCSHLGLDINTSPFGFFFDDVTGVVKVTIRKPGIETLRRLHSVSVTNMHIQLLDDVIVFTAHGETSTRKEVSSGTMSLEGLAGPEKAKAFLLAETKAKHRLTLALVGLGIQEEPDVIAALAKHYAEEPTKAPEPPVNHAPAFEHDDLRKASDAMNAILARGHSFPEPEPEKMAAEMDKPTPTPQNEAVAKPTTAPVFAQEGGFNALFGDDMSPNADIPESSRTATLEPRDDRPSIPDAPDAREIHGQDFVQPPVEEPVYTQPAGAEEKLTPIEFKAFTARCTKLVRDVLPKVSKEAPGLLLPFLKRKFGTNDIQTASRSLWETTLTQIESASNADKLVLLKGK